MHDDLTNEPTKNEALPSISLLMLRWLGSQQINQHNLEFRTFLTCHKICENGKLCNFIRANPFCDSKRFCSKQYLISFLLVLNILRCKKKDAKKRKLDHRENWVFFHDGDLFLKQKQSDVSILLIYLKTIAMQLF